MDNRNNPPAQYHVALLRERLEQAQSSTAPQKKFLDKELQGATARLKSQLFTAREEKIDPQKATTLKDLETLQARAGNVREKINLLEEFFKKSSLEVNNLKKNEVSRNAKKALVLPEDKASFDRQQDTFLDEVNVKVKNDIRTLYYNNALQLTMPFHHFLQLSLTYRAYQVCLEQDFRRHAAMTLSELTGKSRRAAQELAIVKSMCGIPTQYAVESLNYYADFFTHLNDIEKIWPGAGKTMRTLEIKILFTAVFNKDKNTLLAILEKNDRAGMDRFNQDFEKRLAIKPSLKAYIDYGDGLNAARHPWTANDYERLPQPNKTLNISEMVPENEVHAEAIHEVETRVSADRRRFVF